MSRPKHVPTQEQRDKVKALSAYGLTQEGIARVFGIRSVKTLRKHYRSELELGEIEAVATVSQTQFQMAKSGKHENATNRFLDHRKHLLKFPDSETRQALTPDFVVNIEKEVA